MFCHHCGSQVAGNLQFCPNCGQSLASPAAGPGGGAVWTPAPGLHSQTGKWIGEGWELVKSDIGTYALIALVMGLGLYRFAHTLADPDIWGHLAIGRLYYETGRREYQQTGEREGVLTTYEAETFSAADCLTVVGWYRKALELCGASGVQVAEEECRAQGGPVCRYRVSWTSP